LAILQEYKNNMFQTFSYYLIFGKPLVVYLGILALSGILLTAFIAITARRGIRIIHFKWHPRLAIISIILGLCHGILVALASI